MIKIWVLYWKLDYLCLKIWSKHLKLKFKCKHPEVLGPAGLYKDYSTKSFDNSCIDEKVKIISDHVPVHRKPVRDDEFGYYLAGLIEGDGYISKEVLSITIAFNHLDAPLAYYIKNRIGSGVVDKVKNKNALVYRANSAGCIVIANLINGKLRTDKIKNFNCLLELINKRRLTPGEVPPIEKDTSDMRNSNWLAGFTDADGSFQVKILNREARKLGFEIRLNYQLDQKNRLILDQIKEVFGGSIGHRKSQDTFYYASVSFGSAVKFVNYFDQFNLLSSKHLNYLKWRNVYSLVQRKEHLTKNGIKKIIRIKSHMNDLSKDSFEL